MRKNKKKGEESKGDEHSDERGGDGREACDEKRDKTSGDIFGKCLENPSGQLNSIQ